MTKYRFAKTSGTHADAFVAVGLASLLERAGIRSEIRDVSGQGVFEIEAEREVTGEAIRRVGLSPGYSYFQAKDEPIPAVVSDVFRYLEQKEKVQRQREARQQARAGGMEVAELAQEDQPRGDYRLYQALNLLQGDGGSNKAFLQIVQRTPDEWSEELWQSLKVLARGEQPETAFDSSLLQLFTPNSAKGYARLKPDSTSRNDKTKDAWGNGFLEWLRYQGYFASGCPFLLGSKGEHVRLITVLPHRIQTRLLLDVISGFRKEIASGRILGSAPKIDSLATLYVARTLVTHSEEFQGEFSFLPDLISGISITHYQSMGNAKAVTGLERLSMPGWLPVRSQEDADLWINVLDEHAGRLRMLQDNVSDEIGLLMEYRRFLQQRGEGAWPHLMTFLEAYGIFLMRQRGQNKWRHKQFLWTHVEAILANTELRSIIENKGFLAVADALRSATVSAQISKKNKAPDYREIRYDILPELKRKRVLPQPEEFIEAISGFVASYNAESVKRLESGSRSGTKRVSTEDFQEFLLLLESCRENRNGIPLLGALLCAYATCRKPKEPEEVVSDAETNQEGEEQES